MGGYTLEKCGGLNPKLNFPAQNSRAGKRHPQNIWLEKAAGFLSARERWLETRGPSSRANAQNFIHSHSRGALAEGGQSVLEPQDESPELVL